jgi:alkylation response protein AidB-like acyl-CoA dehydrogenase
VVATEDVDAWVREHWSEDLTVGAWWALLAGAGLAAPTFPIESGGCGWVDVRPLVTALAAAGAIGPPTGLGMLMGAPVVLTNGTPEQQVRMIPPLLRGEESWCQLFSEPAAGSDLAGVRTRAVRDGDEWIVTGQKVWTSGAAVSGRGMLVARTDTDVPKHRGLTYFVIDMDQPGVEVRPLRQMNGQAHFSEVFLTEARVADTDRVGVPGGGWAVTLATLAFERSGLSAGEHLDAPRPVAGPRGDLDRRVGDLIEEHRRRGATDAEAWTTAAAMQRIARDAGRTDDPVVRQRLAQVEALERVAAWSRGRVAAAAARGRTPGPEASTAKLGWTNALREVRDLSLELLGPQGALGTGDAPYDGRVQGTALSIPSASIAGGSDEIQRNIIAERALGLPKDVQVDRDLPFKDVPAS